MKTAILSVSRQGYALARQLKAHWPQAELFTSGPWREPEDHGVEPDLKALTARLFETHQALCFIMAAGIAVRMVAPHLTNKTRDPAVLVLDDQGRWVIPLLSGHLGGANRLAQEVADFLGAQAVVTTATEGRGLTAVDLLAQERGWVLTDLERTKRLTAALLEGERLPVVSWKPLKAALPPEYVETEGLEENRPCLMVTPYVHTPKARELWLIPRCITLGIGCRRGTSYETLLAMVEEALDALGLDRRSLSRIASIDLKKDEPALLRLSEAYQVPLTVYSAAELAEVAEHFDGSAFVKTITGVEAVSEPAGYLASQGRCLLPKQAQSGITLSIWEDC